MIVKVKALQSMEGKAERKGGGNKGPEGSERPWKHTTLHNNRVIKQQTAQPLIFCY